MVLKDINKGVNSIYISEGFILEIDDELLESLSDEIDEILEEGNSGPRNIETAMNKYHDKNVKFLASKEALIRKAEKIIKAGMKKNTLKTAKLIAKVRYFIKNGKPTEDSVFPETKGDIERIKQNEKDGTNKVIKLKPGQIRYKNGPKPEDGYRTLTLDNLFALKIGTTVYTIESSANVIDDYAKTAAPVVVKSREIAAKICNTFKMKAPYIPKSIAEAEKYIMDTLIRPTSKAAKLAKAKEKAFKAAKAAEKAGGPAVKPQDAIISTDAYEHGKVKMLIELRSDPIVKALNLGSFSATKIPDDWNDSKAAWGRQAKANKALVQSEVEAIVGSHGTVKVGNAGGTIKIVITN